MFCLVLYFCFNCICILYLSGTIKTEFSHACQHKAPSIDEVVHDVHVEPHHVMKKRSIDQIFRLKVVYDDQSIIALGEREQKLIKESLIPSAVNYWQQALRVRHTAGPIKLQRQCRGSLVRYKNNDPYPYCVEGCMNVTRCGEVPVPSDHLDTCRVALRGKSHRTEGVSGPGVTGVDFILYVSAVETARCDIGTTVAYAAYCQLESAFDRPVAGYVNLCPEEISTHRHDLDQMHSTIKHEILHALGFSVGLFAFYRDGNGDPLTPRLHSTGRPHYDKKLHVHSWSDRTIKTVTYSKWKVRSGWIEKNVSVMVTPNVQREVRQHFNCSTLEGAELEDQDVIGTALSHWEKRVFENEAMTGTYTQSPVISRVTLAAMEDTGWYSADYGMADRLEWGRGLGCDFVQRSCMEWMETKRLQRRHIHPYCEIVKRPDSVHTECTEDRSAVALCNLIEYQTPLPHKYQYFQKIPGVADSDLSRYGGLVALADYCPYIQEFTWKRSSKSVGRGSQCDVLSRIQPRYNYFLEAHGPDSLCFEHQGAWRLQQCELTHTVEHWGSGCYQYHCSPDVGLTIVVHEMEYLCQDDLVLNISIVTDHWLHTGSLICPSCRSICQHQLHNGCPAPYTVLQNSLQREPVVGELSYVIPCNSAMERSPVTSLRLVAMVMIILCSRLTLNAASLSL